MNEEETKNLIKTLVKSFNDHPINKGVFMKLLKARPDIDMAIAAKLVNQLNIC